MAAVQRKHRPDKLDIDRRHVVRVPVDKAAMEVLTPGSGLEWTPVVTGDGATVAMISATAQRPPLPTVMAFTKGTPKVLAQNLVPANFPQNQLVTPKQVIFKAPDGMTVHGQLFEPAGRHRPKSPTERSPALFMYTAGHPARCCWAGIIPIITPIHTPSISIWPVRGLWYCR